MGAKHDPLLEPLGPEAPDVTARRAAFREPTPPTSTLPGDVAQLISLPPHFYPPAHGAQEIEGHGSALVGPGPANWAAPAGVQHLVGIANVAMVRVFGIGVINIVGTSNITTTLQADGSPLSPAQQIVPQPAAFARESWDFMTYLIFGNKTISLLISVLDGGTYNLTGYWHGWEMSLAQFNKMLGGA